MPLTWTDLQTKAQAITGDTTPTTLAQLKQDMNVGYQRFNASVSRYFTRKQQFTNLVANQQYYQLPVDAIRVTTVTVQLSNGYIYPVIQCRSEEEWRKYNIVPYTSSYAMYYFMLGNDQIGLYPTPSDSVTNGLRFVYQPQDVYLTKDDYTTGTVAVTQSTTSVPSVTVTGTGTSWAATMIGELFTVTDGSDGNWYEIIDVPNATTLTLKTPYVGTTGSAKAYRIGEAIALPVEYSDVPLDYALSRYFELKNNPKRALYHMSNFNTAKSDAVARYATSSTSVVITDENDSALNLWYMPPMPGV